MAAGPIQNIKTFTMEKPSPLSFIFDGDEMIVQCTASRDDEAEALETLKVAKENYCTFSDGKHAAAVRLKGTTTYWITSAKYAQTLNKKDYAVIGTTLEPPTVKAPIRFKTAEHHKVSKAHIRRPRNQFIIYRQWMSARLHAENSGMTAALISQVVANMWRAEKPEIRAHFKALADEEDRLHKLKYPGYRFEAGRRNPSPALHKRNLPHDPMTVAERMVAEGF